MQVTPSILQSVFAFGPESDTVVKVKNTGSQESSVLHVVELLWPKVIQKSL